jgi:hypothetical protein
MKLDLSKDERRTSNVQHRIKNEPWLNHHHAIWLHASNRMLQPHLFFIFLHSTFMLFVVFYWIKLAASEARGWAET